MLKGVRCGTDKGCLQGAGNFSDLAAEMRRSERLVLSLVSEAVSKRVRTAGLQWPGACRGRICRWGRGRRGFDQVATDIAAKPAVVLVVAAGRAGMASGCGVSGRYGCPR